MSKEISSTVSEDLDLISPESLIKRAPFPFTVVDCNMNIVRIGPHHAGTLSGKIAEELIGKPITSFYPSIANDLKACIDHVFTTGVSHTVEIDVKRASGKENSEDEKTSFAGDRTRGWSSRLDGRYRLRRILGASDYQ